jgi:hypothetical protein
MMAHHPASRRSSGGAKITSQTDRPIQCSAAQRESPKGEDASVGVTVLTPGELLERLQP